ncbi:hypothetical protein FN846DRAFT_613296 [Sphaerosporella brunnea]|uniref:VHS domain-containing protein n=1 Tax=Sphaerosporella brunnea TaxID=1250544 RepID=A0A5J5ECS5_9PEZI|nr:hypothetical protein FN846DRAFT_613296 [Sphaerosporella brunnea]
MKKPYTAVTVLIERLTSEEYEENDYGGLPELIETIKLQDSGPTEASRAIRKKLKYGNVHRQLRALTLLDGLISNAGPRFQRTFADEPLLERLRLAATDSTTDPDVKAKLKALFTQWAQEYKDTQGLSSVANLYKQLPRKPRPAATVTKPAPAPAPSSPTTSTPRSPISPSSSSTFSPVAATTHSSIWGSSSSSNRKSSSKSKNKHHASFNLEKEKPALNQALANASIASTNLNNALKLVNREKERVSEKREVVLQYDQCKTLRSTILRYIQLVESEQWLGSLINAHEELSHAIATYEVYDKPIEEDSDSEDEWNRSDGDEIAAATRRMAGLTVDEGPAPAMPPRPKGKAPSPPVPEPEEPEEEYDPDDPFGNQYEVVDDGIVHEDTATGMRWKVL